MFAKRSNPFVDRPILRKSKNYVEQQVSHGRAHWVDPEDHKKGIVCREMLYFGERALKPEPVSAKSSPRPNLRWEPPKTEAWLMTLRTSNITNVRQFAAL